MKGDDKPGAVSLPAEPPAGLEVHTLRRGRKAVLVASYPLAQVRLPDALTPAERSVVEGALRGRSNAEIARDRRSSTRTVANLLARAFRKLEVGSRAELAAKLVSAK